MLLQFNFKNFKSFREEATLDLTAAKITEKPEHIVPLGQEKVLPVAAVFGANASGKSNVVEALRFMQTYVLESFGYGGETSDRAKKERAARRSPFAFDLSGKSDPSFFEVYFITSAEEGCKSFHYGFALNESGVVEEWLNVKAKTAREFKPVFYRGCEEETDLSGLPPRSRDNLLDALEKETLIVSLGAKLKIDKLKAVRNWFAKLDFSNFGDPLENVILSRLIPAGFADSKEIQDDVVHFFSAFDPSITGFQVRTMRRTPEDNDSAAHVEIDAIHRIPGTNQTAAIPLEEESEGTLKMFALYPMLREARKNGGIFCIDELNSKLHPLLVRNILIAFLNPALNPKHAQLIFTTHDAWQMSNNLLRRDEIWFTEKNAAGVSSLYSLADFVDSDGVKIRKDENYEKNYLLGKYGAIPTLKCFDIA